MASTDPTNEEKKVTLDQATLKRIDQALQAWDDTSSEVRRLYEESQQKWVGIVQPLVEAISNSERLSEEDLAVRINTRD